MPDFLDIAHIAPEEIRNILELARCMKSSRRGRRKGERDDEPALEGVLAALVFEKPSTRTRVSFDVAVRQLGGQTILLSKSELQLGQGESIGDTAQVLERYVDIAMIRTFEARTLTDFSRPVTIPVINGLTNATHPCQVMADIMTFEERKGAISGAHAVWIGPGTNVTHSLLEAAAWLGFDVTLSGPREFDADPEYVEFARRNGRKVRVERDPVEAVSNADVIFTDTWASMHESKSDMSERIRLLGPYRVNRDLMNSAPHGTLFMHCLPAHRGEEVTSEVMDGPNSVVFDEAENRLHVQKAILRWCLDR